MPKNYNDNYNHTELIWSGKFKKLAELPAKRKLDKISLPFQTIEVINEPREGTAEDKLIKGQQRQGWRNKLIWGDNKLVMASLLKEFAGEIDLIYIDPPFDLGADFSIKVKIGDQEVTKKPSILEEKTYRDTWGKGTDSYLQMMYERLLLMRDLLSEKGSIYVHLDWHVGHYVKAIMDEIFGRDNFQREIAVSTGWALGFKASANNWIRKHDFILFYNKTPDNFIFNKQYVPYEVDYTKRARKDPDGRLWVDQSLGQISKEKLEELKKEGNVFQTKTGGWRKKQYLEEMKGESVGDIWTDIPPINSQAIEKQNYATQKSEKLLERIIKASSKENDIIADFFCGSGTTGVVAEKLGRRWIMCDLGRFAIHTSRKRLMDLQRKLKEEGKSYYPFEILNLGKYERQHWQVAVVNGGKKTSEAKKIAQYIKFIIELYSAEPINGFCYLHGRKENNFVHIGAVDAPVTMNEIKESIDECKKNRSSHLDILGWEWEMGVNEEAIKWAKAQGVRLKLLNIPREVMDKRAVEQGDIKFFELNYVRFDVEKKGGKARVILKEFAIPSEDLIPADLKEKIKKWSDYIDYWSVDWDHENLKLKDDEPIFQNDWQTFRTKKNPKLELETPWHEYDTKGKYTILVKIIDIFGNDTSKPVNIKI